ncbi:HAMP domain-containing sensor histidine kinase [Roseburia hominis]
MKVRMKITLCVLGLLSLLLGIGSSFLISLSFQDTLAREKDTAFGSYKMILETLQLVGEFNPSHDYDTVDQVIRQLDQQTSRNWLALSLSSESGYAYESDQAGHYFTEMNVHRTFTQACLATKTAGTTDSGTVTFRYETDPTGNRYLLLAGTFPAVGDTLTLRMAYDISPVYRMRQVQQQIYLRLFLVMLLIGSVLSYAMSRLITAPLEKLSTASRAIASGDYSSRVGLYATDEIGTVAADFDTMAEQMEQYILKLQESLLRQERFMGSFAHELKTPMTSIIGYAELLREEILSQEERVEAADYIVSEGKRLERLSRKLLSLFGLKQEAPSFSAANPAAIVHATVEQLGPLYETLNIRLVCKCQGGVCYLETSLVRSLLLNLLDNARKSMDSGGTILIHQEMLADGCRIRILDEGRGVPSEALPHLTEAFYRVDKARSRQQGGVGLGLALCKEIVELHHGTIRIRNRKKRGTSVTVELRGGRPCTK